MSTVYYMFGLDGRDNNYRIACKRKFEQRGVEETKRYVRRTIDRMKENASVRSIYIIKSYEDIEEDIREAYKGGNWGSVTFKIFLEQMGTRLA